MASLETVVRPYQSPNFNPPKSRAVSCTDTPDTVTLTFGQGGQGRIFSLTYSHAVKKYMTKQQKEIRE